MTVLIASHACHPVLLSVSFTLAILVGDRGFNLNFPYD